MKKKILILLIIFSYLQNYGQKSLILLDLDDCINSQSNLVHYYNDQNQQQINVVCKYQYKSDSVDIINLFNLNQIKHKLIFSDSIYKLYEKPGMRSTIVYLNESGNKVLKSIPLKEYSSSNSMSQKEKCILETDNYGYYNLFYPNYLIKYRMSLGKFIVHNLNNGKSLNFIADSSWLEEGYKAYIGNKYLEYYHQMLEINNNYAGTKSKILAMDINNTTLSILFDIGFPKYDSALDAVRISKICLVREYDLASNQFINTYPILEDTLRNMGYYVSLGGFYKLDDVLYVSLKKSNSIDYCTLGKFVLNKNSNYVFSGFVLDSLPQNYKKYNLNNLFNRHLFSDEITTINHSEYLFNISTSKKYNMPIADSNYSNLSLLIENLKSNNQNSKLKQYVILDIKSFKQYIYVLYALPNQNIYLSTFQKDNSSAISNNIIFNNDNFSLVKFHPTENKILYIEENDNCIQEITY